MGLRLRAATEASVEAALAGKAVARTWLLLGTLHLATAGDVRWLLYLVGARAPAATACRHRELGLGARAFAKAERLLGRAPEPGRCRAPRIGGRAPAPSRAV